jgi:5-methylcytosine-specific restriction protein B
LSKYNPNHYVDPIYDAAQKWSERSLASGLSVLSEKEELWTRVFLDELDQRFVNNLDAGEGDFLSKLKTQLSEGTNGCRQLMAELLWIMLLFPSNIGAAKKRENVRTIWSWSGEDLSTDNAMLSDQVLEGIGSGGVAFNTYRWLEIGFLIGALRDFTQREELERRSLLEDPWAFSSWLSSLPEARKRQLIHILPHLLFPDTFERISSEGDKRQILAGFGRHARERSPKVEHGRYRPFLARTAPSA